MKRSLATVLAVALFVEVLAAQSFNVDIGSINAGAAGGGTPAPSYGAAAARPGMWNYITGIGTGPYAFVDVNNNPTAVTCVRDDGIGGLFGSNNSQTTGYFQSLMDDAHSIGAPGVTHSYTISGLAAGTYRIYTYAWSPLSAAHLTNVTVPGAATANPQLCGGALPAVNTFQLGTTHTVHVVSVAPGASLVIQATAAAGYAFINGFQIVDGYGLSLAQPVVGGPLSIVNSFGTPGNIYANLFTLYQGAFPNGGLYGLDLSIPDAINLVLQGPPFLGFLNANGAASFSVPGLMPSGITIYCVSLQLDPTLSTVLEATAPFAYTTL